jgi:hypothetical protein
LSILRLLILPAELQDTRQLPDCILSYYLPCFLV